MIISRDGGMGGIVAVGGGREPEKKTMVVAVSAVAGEGGGRGTGEDEGERFATATTTKGCGGYKREGGRVPRGGEVVDSKWGVYVA